MHFFVTLGSDAIEGWSLSDVMLVLDYLKINKVQTRSCHELVPAPRKTSTKLNSFFFFVKTRQTNNQNTILLNFQVSSNNSNDKHNKNRDFLLVCLCAHSYQRYHISNDRDPNYLIKVNLFYK